ncbi:hypothetical protein C8R43DRAFT_893578 [Mycena crocata]|nr:hypothetical protein C8R43DRAFT_893578 [Mycena crocata]
MLNILGAERFARDTNQELVEFSSIDRLSSRGVDKSKWKGCEQTELNKISKQLRHTLWDSIPSTTSEFIPGKLKICVGMPIMLRSNEATELCLTKGQEGIVVGWDDSEGPSGQRVLDTLFVELINPPRNVQIGELPINIVPIPRTTTPITSLLPDDTLLSLLREQVVVLLNFGMTDYTAQGKSRDPNCVELSHCDGHKSYYVALSRGFTAEGTIILQDFDEKHITGGMSGYLRQELRELEILDEITRLRTEGLLPSTVTGLYRRRLLRSYYAWKSDHRDPAHFHTAMKWTPSMGPRIPAAVTYSDWRPTHHVKKKVKTEQDDDKPVDSKLPDGKKKRKRVDSTLRSKDAPKTKQQKKVVGFPAPYAESAALALSDASFAPCGLIWDSANHSCGYDAILTVLANIWREDRILWGSRFDNMNPIMYMLSDQLSRVAAGERTFEQGRNSVRAMLHNVDQAAFPYGPEPTSMDRIGLHLLRSEYYGTGMRTCPACGLCDGVRRDFLSAFSCAGLSERQVAQGRCSLSGWWFSSLYESRRKCARCFARGVEVNLQRNTVLRDVPPIMMICVDDDRIVFDEHLHFSCSNGSARLKLKGIVYGGHGHFTSRVMHSDGFFWFHDGITTGRRCQRDVRYEDLANPLELHRCRNDIAVAVVYCKV